MVAPIFKFRNVKIRVTNTAPVFVYGVVSNISNLPDSTLASGVSASEVSAVILTIQISNITGAPGVSGAPAAQPVQVSSFIQNSTSTSSLLNTSRILVSAYPLIPQNAFDPLNGNLILSENDQLWVSASVGNSVDVTVSLLEIANALAT